MIYRVRKEWDQPKTQIGAYSILSNAINACQEGYKVFDEAGKVVYPENKKVCPYAVANRVLKRGCYGEDVKWLQWQLIELGFDCGKSGVDGDFGNNTLKGLMDYQAKNDLEVDGICGPKTKESLLKNGYPSEVNPQPITFVPRLKIPENGNPYYNRIENGGYGTSIKGNPLNKGLTVLNNCVGWAAARFNEIIGKGKWVYLNYPPNAEDFIDKARSEGLEISQTPSLGAIIVWAKGETHNSKDGAGHVAVVEQINSDGSIITSESGYNCNNSFWTTHRRNDGNWGAGTSYRFLGFIKNPNVR